MDSVVVRERRMPSRFRTVAAQEQGFRSTPLRAGKSRNDPSCPRAWRRELTVSHLGLVIGLSQALSAKPGEEFPNEMAGKRLWVIATLLGLVLIRAPAFILLESLQGPSSTASKNSGMILPDFYAAEYGASSPVHTNGFGDGWRSWFRKVRRTLHGIFVGVGDDGAWLQASCDQWFKCSRGSFAPEFMFRGLDETKYELAILFDRYAVRGGDHFRSIFRP